MHARFLVIVPLLVSGCSDSQISKLTPQPPKVSIDAPAATGRYYSDMEITFSGTVQDNQDDLTTIQTSLVSDAAGELGSYFPGEDGVVTDQLVLPEGAHTLTFEAVDDQGDVGRDTVAITVGPANSVPTCQITTPEDGDAEAPGETVSFRGSVSDADIPATDLVVEWTSDVQGVLSNAAPDSTGITGFQTDALDAFTHVITLRATDEAGAACSDSILFTVGAPPVVSITSPADDSVFSEGESITFRATVEDGEDDADELALSWTSDVDGELNTDPALGDGSVIFNTTALSVGQHIVRLTATDTDGFYSQSAVVISVNGLPTAPAVAISPDPADTTDIIRAVISTPSSDPDGDAVTYTYQWYQDGVATSVSTTNEVDASYTGRGEIWSVDVTPNDGLSDGPAGTASITIANAAPSVATVTLTPDPAFEDSILTCTPSTPVDDDGDAVTLAYAWEVNSVSVSGTTAQLTGSSFGRGDFVSCSVTPDDGVDSGTAVTSNIVTIGNTAPTVSSVSITPDPAYAGDLLTCNYTFSDGDGDSDVSAVVWTRNGTTVGSGTTYSGSFVRGDVMSCTVTPNDGTDAGTAVSASLTVSNTTPSIATVTISPTTAYADDTLTCSYGGFSDPDGDADASTYAWTVNGGSAGTGATLASGFGRGDLVACSVTPADAYGTGSAVSASVTISDSAPVLASVTLSPDPAYESSTLVCTPGSVTDIDGDSVTFAYAWTVGGSSVSSTSATLTGADFGSGDAVSCTVTPTAAGTAGSAVTSNTVTIGNTAPTVSGVAITPDPAYAGDTLTCGYTFSDADGDADASTVAWTNGATTLGTGATYSGSFVRGDTISCTVTPNDGTDAGTAVSDSVTIGNTVPSVASVSISPSPAYVSDTLTCSYAGYSDADGDSDASTYAWTVNGTGAGSGATLSSGYASGDVVACAVTPYDGVGSGSTVSASRTISNSAPSISSATISPASPATTDTLSVSVSGWSDADGDSPGYTYVWTVNGTPAGTSATLSASSTSRGDVIAVSVTPTDGTTSGSAVTASSVTVGNTAPTVSSVAITPDPAYAGDTLTCGYTFTDVDGDSDASTVVWTNGATTLGTGSTYSGSFVRSDTITCTVTPSDGTDSGTAGSDSVTIGNTVPSVSSVSISPSTAYVSDTLTCSYSGYSDADGDADASTYAWTVGGSTVGTSATLSSGFSSGDTVTCTVTPYDGVGSGSTVVASRTISNSAPSISSATISPASPTTSDTLSVTASGWSDADGDSPGYTYVWTVNGTPAGTSATLSASSTSRGDVIAVSVTPTDGTTSGSTVTASSVTIGNTAPTVSSVAITPDPAYAGDSLTCGYTFTDADGDTDASTVVWTNGATTLGTGTTYSGSVSNGDTITCTVTPSDGTDSGTAGSDSITIGNSAPSITSVSISPSTAYVTDTLTCSYTGYSDADGDADASTYAWTVGGSTVGTSATLSSGFSAGDTVACVVTPYDGTTAGTTVSDSLVISNSVPSVSSATISPASPVTSETLSVTASGWSDADGDAEGYDYAWTINGTASSTSSTLASSLTTKGDVIAVTLTPNDGTDTGTPVVASSVTVANSAPVLTGVAISPSAPTDTDTLTCASTGTTDADSDTVSVTYAWTVNGTSAGTGATLSSGYSAGDTVVCTGTPSDGTDSGTAASDTVTISSANAAPVMTSVTLSPSTVYTDSTITATAAATDAEGDTITYSYVWTVSGSTVAATGSTLSGATYFDKTDTVSVSVTPNDGTSSGTAMASSTVTVVNSTPTTPTLSITPASPDAGVDDLVCAVSTASTDADGDTISYTVSWTVGGSAWTGTTTTTTLTGDTVPGASTAAAEVWTCSVVASDGSASATAATASVTIAREEVAVWPRVVERLDEVADLGLFGETANDYAGTSVKAVGDVDGDGLEDMLIGAYRYDSNFLTDNGAAYLVLGSTLATATEFELATDADYIFEGTANSDQAGSNVVGPGDIDGDGLDDLMISARYDDTSYSNSGTVHVIFAADLPAVSSSGPVMLDLDADSSVSYYGWGSDVRLGGWGSMAGAGDVDGDGLADILLGANNCDSGGSSRGDRQCYVYLIYGATVSTSSGGNINSTSNYDHRIDGTDGTGFGRSLASAGDVDGDGFSDIIIGGFYDDTNGSNSGAAYLFFGVDFLTASTNLSYTAANYSFLGMSASDECGVQVNGVGDVDGDTLDDIAVGCWLDDANGRSNSGTVAVVLGGGLAPSGGTFYLSAADYLFHGETSDDRLGFYEIRGGDVDGDGLNELLLNAYLNDDRASNRGKVYVFEGATLASLSGSVAVEDADFTLVPPENAHLRADSGMDLADLDDDGLADIIIGCNNDDTNGSDAGAVYVVYSDSLYTGGFDIELEDAEYMFTGSTAADEAGFLVTGIGDMDYDGLDDVAIAVPYWDSSSATDAGGVYVFFSRFLVAGNQDIDTARAAGYARFVYGEAADDRAGSALGGGDFNGDGKGDLLVGAPYNNEGGSLAGKAYLLVGSSSTSSTSLGSVGREFIGDAAADYLGWSVASAGDVDGDGTDDVLIGAPYNDDAGVNRGKAYLYLGSSVSGGFSYSGSDADYAFYGENNVDYAGYTLASAGDVDGDGLDDILVGARGNDDGGNFAGKAYLFLAADLPAAGGDVALSTAHFSFTGEAALDYASETLAGVGDVDGDGLDDMLFGAPGNDDGGSAAGKAYLVLGSSVVSSGTMDLGDADAVFYGESDNENLAVSLAAAGDVDGDGYADFLIGADGNDEWGTDAGKSYLLMGWSVTSAIAASAWEHEFTFDDGQPDYDYAFVGEGTSQYSGAAVGGAGDIDGDGLDDLVFGAYGYSASKGRVYIKLSDAE